MGHKSATVGVCLVAAAGAAGVPAAAWGTVSPQSPPRGVPAAARMHLVLPLRADLAGLERFARSVTTPGSPDYGQYESIAALARRFGAPASRRRRVLEYLRRAGATGLYQDRTGLFVDATLPAATAERLFRAPLAVHRMAHGAAFTAPLLAPNIPAGLRGLVTGVVGLDTRPVLTSAAPRRLDARAAAAQTPSGYTPATGTPAGCPSGVATHAFTPVQYLTAYNFGPLLAAGLRGQGERVALIEIDGFKRSDIATYASCFGLRVPKINSFGVGFKRSLRAGGEATLDLEVLDSAAPGLRAIDVYESRSDEASALRALTAPLQNTGYKPQVISASLGLCEQYAVEAVGPIGISTVNAALAEAAASGITLLDSSGDSGSADCVQNTAQGMLPVDTLAVNFPASSAWVTGVGGTNLVLNPDNTISNQTVWDDSYLQPGSAGGGGESILFHRPSYQRGIVGSNRREVPDIAMLADVAPGYAIYCTVPGDCISAHSANPWQAVGGTSAGTPLAAGGFASIDQDLRLQGRQDLGLVNPLLYGIGRNAVLRPAVFSDVVAIGNDVGPEISFDGAALGCCAAKPGYDDASGWGSINMANFAAQAVALEPKVVGVSITLPAKQRPIAAGGIAVTVRCGGRCLLSAQATVAIAASRPFFDHAGVYHLSRRGSRRLLIPFSNSERSRLRGALRAGRKIIASVAGTIVDPAGNVQRESTLVRLRIAE
jgi:subtilase family serine protease